MRMLEERSAILLSDYFELVHLVELFKPLARLLDIPRYKHIASAWDSFRNTGGTVEQKLKLEAYRELHIRRGAPHPAYGLSYFDLPGSGLLSLVAIRRRVYDRPLLAYALTWLTAGAGRGATALFYNEVSDAAGRGLDRWLLLRSRESAQQKRARNL